MDTVEAALSKVTGDNSVIHINNGKRTLTADQRTGPLGTCKWTVVYEFDLCAEIRELRGGLRNLTERLAVQDEKIALHDNKFELLETISTEPYIRNVAATILHYLAGTQPKDNVTSTRFTRMRGPDMLRVDECAISLGLTNVKFKTLADSVLNRRNVSIHPADTEGLETIVKHASDMIDAYPRMRKSLKDEVTIIDNFDEIKSFFPCK